MAATNPRDVPGGLFLIGKSLHQNSDPSLKKVLDLAFKLQYNIYYEMEE
jgi:hypothetical protein